MEAEREQFVRGKADKRRNYGRWLRNAIDRWLRQHELELPAYALHERPLTVLAVVVSDVVRPHNVSAEYLGRRLRALKLCWDGQPRKVSYSPSATLEGGMWAELGAAVRAIQARWPKAKLTAECVAVLLPRQKWARPSVPAVREILSSHIWMAGPWLDKVREERKTAENAEGAERHRTPVDDPSSESSASSAASAVESGSAEASA
ncbi:MAG: hypothetical protein PHU85_00240 [Phycisphaerae bacterium]|nr:hypothetical protein [Phycisphaerae bacterium]